MHCSYRISLIWVHIVCLLVFWLLVVSSFKYFKTHAWSTCMLLLLHSAFVVKMLLKREVRGCALNSHGNYIVNRGKSWKNHEIVFLNFCGYPVVSTLFCFAFQLSTTSTHSDVGWFDGSRSW